MAIDNSLYDSIENTYKKIQNYLDTTQLGKEHSAMIIKQEELSELLERLDIEAIEEQWPDINALHEKLNDIKEDSNQVAEALQLHDDSVVLADKVVTGLDKVFSKIANVI